MRKLKNITLVAFGSTDVEGMYHALEHSKKGIEWGAVKLITEIPCTTIDEWNKAIIFDLRRFIDTDYCMLIHPDGFVVHAESWREDFLRYDYIGAPWPLPSDTYSYRTPDGEIIRVGNSVSIRSQKILNLPYELEFAWRPYFGNTNEDGFLTCHNRRLLQHFGAKFAPIEVAKWFSREMEIPENQDVENPFAFHLHDTQPGRNEKYKELIYGIWDIPSGIGAWQPTPSVRSYASVG